MKKKQHDTKPAEWASEQQAVAKTFRFAKTGERKKTKTGRERLIKKIKKIKNKESEAARNHTA